VGGCSVSRDDAIPVTPSSREEECGNPCTRVQKLTAPVESLTPPDLAGALPRLLNDPAARTRLSRAGRRRAYGYSWAAVAAEDVYQRLLAERE
jgi:hypothetical protein